MSFHLHPHFLPFLSLPVVEFKTNNPNWQYQLINRLQPEGGKQSVRLKLFISFYFAVITCAVHQPNCYYNQDSPTCNLQLLHWSLGGDMSGDTLTWYHRSSELLEHDHISSNISWYHHDWNLPLIIVCPILTHLEMLQKVKKDYHLQFPVRESSK